eukprot:666138-Hanusia_phi.AAC.1
MTRSQSHHVRVSFAARRGRPRLTESSSKRPQRRAARRPTRPPARGRAAIGSPSQAFHLPLI